MNYKISVIVPVYNVEKYLDKCLDSLVNQTYDNLEIVVVNDYSTDNSEKIIKKYVKKYNNIIYIKNEKNRGLSFSRNVGLKNASGDYIGYIDSDDYVSDNYYESLMNTIVNEKAEIAICDINVIYEENGLNNRCLCGNKKNHKIDFVNNGLAASACNKLFNKKNIEMYKFEEGKVNEDIAVVIPTIVKAKRVAYNDEVYYNYVQRKNSIQNSSISYKRFDIFYGVEQTLTRIKKCKNYDDFKDAIIYQQLILLFIYVLPKEPSLYKRRNLFKKFDHLSKQYNIRRNKYLWQFLSSQGKKHMYYYKLLLKLNCNHLYFFSSLCVSFYNFFKKYFTKSVINQNIKMDDLIGLSKYQQNLNKNEVTLSVIVPNYNYEKFLLQRLYSILYQDVKINEIIILDDCSNDNSQLLIDEIVKNLSPYINIKSVYNEKNSGSAFKQWEKGFNLAVSDYVWIAEADDYCNKKMLKNLLKPILNDKNIIISYCDTAFIDTFGNIIVKTIVPEIDIMKTGHWGKSYIVDGKYEFENYSFLNCTIANVSSCIIKKDNYHKEFKQSGEYKQAGDWLFYVNIMQRGKVAYNKKTYNYYRVHGNNVSSTFKKKKHLDEINRIYNYYLSKHQLSDNHKKNMKKRIDFLIDAWEIKDEKKDK